MLKKLIAFACLTISINANAAFMEYRATEANIQLDDTGFGIGFIGSFFYDPVQDLIIFADLTFSFWSNFAGTQATYQNFPETDRMLLAGFSAPFEFGQVNDITFTSTGMNNTGIEYFNRNGDVLTAGTFDRVVPIPVAAWLFGSALLGLGAIKRKANSRNGYSC